MRSSHAHCARALLPFGTVCWQCLTCCLLHCVQGGGADLCFRRCRTRSGGGSAHKWRTGRLQSLERAMATTHCPLCRPGACCFVSNPCTLRGQGGCAFSIYIWGQRTESDAQSLHMIGRDTVRTDGWYSTLTNAVHYLISICRNFRSCPLTVILPYKRQSIGPVTICGWLQRMQRR